MLNRDVATAGTESAQGRPDRCRIDTVEQTTAQTPGTEPAQGRPDRCRFDTVEQTTSQTTENKARLIGRLHGVDVRSTHVRYYVHDGLL